MEDERRISAPYWKIKRGRGDCGPVLQHEEEAPRLKLNEPGLRREDCRKKTREANRPNEEPAILAIILKRGLLHQEEMELYHLGSLGTENEEKSGGVRCSFSHSGEAFHKTGEAGKEGDRVADSVLRREDRNFAKTAWEGAEGRFLQDSAAFEKTRRL